jgi:hypothetical protein
MADPITMSESGTINLTAKEQASHESSQELVRNALHRVASDGSEDINALQYLAGIAANTLLLGANPHKSSVVVHATTARQTLIAASPNTRIRIFDILLSINAACNISFYPDDKSTTPIFPRMFAPNPGQGFSFNSIRGYPLPRGSGLCVVASAAVDYSVGVSYAEEPDNS